MSYNEETGKTRVTAVTPLGSLLALSDPLSVTCTSLLIDCQERQLPFAFFAGLVHLNNSLESLTINNLPTGCRVCIYDVFRKLLVFDWLKLEKLVVSRTYVDECYVHLGDTSFPQSLTHITLFGIGLTSIPPMIKTLNRLQHLCAANNIITNIHEFLVDNDLKELSVLDLSENCLTVLPDRLSDITKLSVLDVSHNWLKKTVPISLSQLTLLTEVYLEWNRLELIQEDMILALPHLSLLDVSYNKLKFLSAQLFFHPSLVLLNVAGNEALAYGEDIQRPLPMSMLEELDVSETDLCRLPSWIGGLVNLKALKCANNELHEFGAILELKALQIIGLRNNSIKDLHHFVRKIPDLPQLCRVDVSYNLLDSLPQELQENTALTVDFDGNPKNSFSSTQTSQETTSEVLMPSALKQTHGHSSRSRFNCFR